MLYSVVTRFQIPVVDMVIFNFCLFLRFVFVYTSCFVKFCKRKIVQSWFQKRFWKQDCDVVSNPLVEIATYNLDLFNSALIIYVSSKHIFKDLLCCLKALPLGSFLYARALRLHHAGNLLGLLLLDRLKLLHKVYELRSGWARIHKDWARKQKQLV